MRLHLRLIALIGVLVPRRLRADWRQEWEADGIAVWFYTALRSPDGERNGFVSQALDRSAPQT
jgi:hypothetical protein